ncbi:porin [Cupriavidus pauculus]|uniref:porin n=1 Tax=Cupriavidus pauculus TaxID=82633 RepID=UPI003F73FA9E
MISMFAQAASAQSSVTLYGVVDTGVEFVNKVGPQSNSVTRMLNLSGTVPSRWGLRGSEDLGGGLKSQFVLESGFAPDSGVSNQGGRLFGRQAWVGVSGAWGQVALGRQYTMLFWSTFDADILGPNVYGSSSLDNYLPNARADNSLSYKGKFGGLTLGATYSLGRDTAGSPLGPSATNCAGESASDYRACKEWSALIQYETGSWGVSAVYDSLRGGPGAFAGLTSSSLKDDRASLNGYMILSKAKLGLGVIARRNEAIATPRSDLWFAGIAYDVTPALNVAAQGYYLRFHNSANKAWLGAVRATYAFSKRSSVYMTAGYIDNKGQSNLSVSSGAAGANPAPGGNQLGVTAGIKHVF